MGMTETAAGLEKPPKLAAGLKESSCLQLDNEDQLRRHLLRHHIACKTAAHISRAAGPQEIFHWLLMGSNAFWGTEVAVEVCLKPAFAPRQPAAGSSLCASLCPSSARVDDGTTDGGEAQVLHYMALGDVGPWADGAPMKNMSGWTRLHLEGSGALRLCLLSGERVWDRRGAEPGEVGGGGWRFPEHALHSEGQDSMGSVLYLPLRGRQDCVGVLCLSSPSCKEFEAANQVTFMAVAEATGIHLQTLQMQHAIELDRVNRSEVAAEHRRMLDDILPTHVVDALCKVRCGLKCPKAEDPEQLLAAAPAPARPSSPCADPSTPLSTNNEPRGSHTPTTPTLQLQELAYAGHHEYVAVLFSSIKGFTTLINDAGFAQGVFVLDRLLGRFDGVVDSHGPRACRVDTVGDAYAIASGLVKHAPCTGEEPGDSAIAFVAVHVAAAMLKAADAVAAPGLDPPSPVTIRIGLHVGQAMSSVICTTVPRYCIFGGAADAPSRMESTRAPGKVHASEEVMHACQWQPRGSMLRSQATGGQEVKGNGFMMTYLLCPAEVVGGLAATMAGGADYASAVSACRSVIDI